MLFKLLCGHALADFALQTEFMMLTKGRNKVPSYLDEKHRPMWPYTLTAHALINAGVVLLITQNPGLAISEFIYHWVIDFIKCEGYINIHTDQTLHIITKIFYSIVTLFT
jgi:hypothetical protein